MSVRRQTSIPYTNIKLNKRMYVVLNYVRDAYKRHNTDFLFFSIVSFD